MYLRAFIDMAAEDLAEALTDEERAALDTFDSLSERAVMKVSGKNTVPTTASFCMALLIRCCSRAES